MTGAAFAACGQWGVQETILLVEDEEFVRKVAAEVLESAGYRLAVAPSAGEALEIGRASAGEIDLLLADIVLPGMSGSDLALEFESLWPQCPILLMSGKVEELARLGHGKRYLAKPFSVATLLNSVRETLEESRLGAGASG